MMVSVEALEALEREVGPTISRGELPPVPVLGWGEISVVLGLLHEGERLACKRLPAFPDQAAVQRYREVCDLYVDELGRLGLTVPAHQVEAVASSGGKLVVYYVQQGVAGDAFVNRLLQRLPPPRAAALLGRVMSAVADLAEVNRDRPQLRIGLDGQVSNWAAPGDLDRDALCYVDTSTPLLRKDGAELLEVGLLLQSLPAPLVPLVKALFLGEILDRYYDARRVLRDLIANLIKERLEGLMGTALEQANALLGGRLSWLHPAPLTEPEVRRYYRSDARMWELLLRLRRLDRFVKLRLLRRPYPFLLPGRIER